MKRGYIYIMTNRSRTLYVGVTSDLGLRVSQHKCRAQPYSFTARYKLDRLVYYDEFPDMNQAIAREKQIKGWLRRKKIALIESMNPGWNDLAADWQSDAIPSPDDPGPSLRSG